MTPDGFVEMAASYDMGWQKRGKGHNSSTGHGAAMGLATGKVMDYATRCKNCRFCEAAMAKGKQATKHDCRKNHEGSSKSMESSVACELWNKAPLSNTRYTVYIGDDDSTTSNKLSHMHLAITLHAIHHGANLMITRQPTDTRIYHMAKIYLVKS